MKITKIMIVAILVLVGETLYSQMHDHSKMNAPKTETLQVSGNCDMCKARIEKAAKVEGVSKADWDQKSMVLTVTFDPAKTNTIKLAVS